MARKLLLIATASGTAVLGMALVARSPEVAARKPVTSSISASTLTPLEPSSDTEGASAHIATALSDQQHTSPAEVTTSQLQAEPTDEQIRLLLEAHPELQASLDALLSESDPIERQEIATLILELAAAMESSQSR